MPPIDRFVEVIESVNFNGALTVFDYNKSMKFRGKSFVAIYSATKNAAESVDILITTPNTDLYFNLSAYMSVNNDAEAFLYESADLSDGTTVTPVNSNRNSSTSATMTIKHTPTVTDPGTAIDNQLLGNNNPLEFNFLLKKNTTYLLRVTVVNNTTKVNVSLAFSED